MRADVSAAGQRRDDGRVVLGRVVAKDLAEGDGESLRDLHCSTDEVNEGPFLSLGLRVPRLFVRGRGACGHRVAPYSSARTPRGGPVNSGDRSNTTTSVPKKIRKAALTLL